MGKVSVAKGHRHIDLSFARRLARRLGWLVVEEVPTKETSEKLTRYGTYLGFFWKKYGKSRESKVKRFQHVDFFTIGFRLIVIDTVDKVISYHYQLFHTSIHYPRVNVRKLCSLVGWLAR